MDELSGIGFLANLVMVSTDQTEVYGNCLGKHFIAEYETFLADYYQKLTQDKG